MLPNAPRINHNIMVDPRHGLGVPPRQEVRFSDGKFKSAGQMMLAAGVSA